MSLETLMWLKSWETQSNGRVYLNLRMKEGFKILQNSLNVVTLSCKVSIIKN